MIVPEVKGMEMSTYHFELNGYWNWTPLLDWILELYKLKAWNEYDIYG